MIVATAGHVDHGKSSLTRAITGVDTDRLPEEKARGLSIDLGYAYWPRDDGTLVGFVDVPGHERFVANMLAGVTGIDAALLVVAADDGPRPQTREHLAILDLLGVTQGLVALTKADRVTETRLEEARRETEALIAPSSLAGAPILATSTQGGAGLDELTRRLAALKPRRHAGGRRFRLAIDRVFTLTGVGLVVTGTVHSGQVNVGQTLALSPDGPELRVRSLHAQDRPVATAKAGARCAVNLSGEGATKAAIRRGQWLVEPGGRIASRRLDVALRLALTETAELRQDQPVHFHSGAADVTGRVVLLDRRSLPPGPTAWAQILLDRPVDAVAGDPFILRDQPARRTLAGGRLVTPFGAARGRARPERLGWLAAMGQEAPDQALARLLGRGEPLDLELFRLARNLDEPALTVARRDLVHIAVPTVQGVYALTPRLWQSWQRAIERLLAESHAERPDQLGLARGEIGRAMIPPRPAAALLDGLLRHMAGERRLAFSSGLYRLPGHQPSLAPGDEATWNRLAAALAERGRQVPVIHELADGLELERAAVLALCGRAARLGLLFHLGGNRYALPATVLELANTMESLAASSGHSTGAFRTAAGIGRNLAVEVLEFFDRRGLTRREGAGRRLLARANDLFGATDS